MTSSSTLGLERLEPRLVLDAGVVITEIVASNDLGLEDEDGNRPDWIELFNAGDASVNLEGWHLTDRASDLDKWTFPSVSLAPQQYLVLFASGKDRTDPAAPLHTNFRVSRDGEYVGLVHPDGVSVASDFGDRYPPQYANVSFGHAQASHQVVLIPAGAAARTWILTDEDAGAGPPGADWTRVEPDDSTWIAGTTGVGFERSAGYEDMLGTDVGEAMYGTTASAFVRVPFTVEHPESIFHE